jgi:hypothetical protein
MRKHFLSFCFLDLEVKGFATILFLLGGLFFLPSVVLAASNTITFDADTNINLWGVNKTLIVGSGGTADAMTVYATSVSFDLESGSSVTVKSADKLKLTSTNGESTTCSGDYSVITLAPTTTVTVTVTPTNSVICAGSSGAGVSLTPSVIEEEVVEEATTTTTTTEEEATEEVAAEETTEEEVVVKPISEMTIEELQAEIVRITALINQLQTELLTMVTSGGLLVDDLQYDDSGEQVKLLQSWLALDSEVYPEAIVSGWFGPLTKAAVIRFQEKYFDDVLAPWGFSKGTGYVGKTTKAKLNELYGGQ